MHNLEFHLVIDSDEWKLIMTSEDVGVRTLHRSISSCKELPDRPLRGLIGMDVTLRVERPKSHLRTGKYAGQLKTSAPKMMTDKPSVCDLIPLLTSAMEGTVFHSRSQVTSLNITKQYADPGEETEISVSCCFDAHQVDDSKKKSGKKKSGAITEIPEVMQWT